jgi:hypothetical protein
MASKTWGIPLPSMPGKKRLSRKVINTKPQGRIKKENIPMGRYNSW